MNRNRPSIHTIGNVTDDTCAQGCTCHRHPRTRRLYIDSNVPGLMLTRYRTCHCCEPWTVEELNDVLRDLADVGTMETA